MPQISFREAEASDLPVILDLYLYFEDDKAKKISLDDATHILEKMHQYPHYKLYVALCDDHIIGSFALLVMDNIVHQANTAIIEAIVIHETYHGQGIGKRLIQYAMQLAKTLHCYKMVLSSNFKWGVHDFYKKLGFKEHGLSFYVDL